MEPILTLKNVNKNYGGIIGAKDVSFEVMPGKIHGLIGPNGAGKSTLMNVISGLIKADGGSVWLGKKNITRIPAYTRSRMGIGRTFQTPRFLNRASIDVNLRLGTDLANHRIGYFGSFFRRKNAGFETEFESYMENAGFKIDLNDDISSLTYGQLKYLEVVRAMLSHPKVMLVDEPAAGLNDKETEKVVTLLKKAAYKQGIGVILIEHAMDVVMGVCKDIVVLNFGKVIAKGTPEDISSNEDVITAYLGRETDD